MIGPVTGTMRQEVVAVSEKDVTVKTNVSTTLNGMTLPADTKAFPIDSKPDPNAGNKDVKIVAESAGTETLKIGAKEYRCTWRAVTTVANAAGMEVKSEAKVWISKDAPVFGMVKTVSTTFGSTTAVEISEAGARQSGVGSKRGLPPAGQVPSPGRPWRPRRRCRGRPFACCRRPSTCARPCAA